MPGAMLTMEDQVRKALEAKRESKYVEFKEEWDPRAPGTWCELLKDLVALANSGGGVIVVGVDNRGNPTAGDVQPLVELDPAVMADKIHHYTESQYADVQVQEASKDGKRVALMMVGPSTYPLVFVKPGTYPVADGQQRTAFSRGTVYFRHGAKSEPGTSDDLRLVVERRVNDLRKSWMEGVRKVVLAPAGYHVAVLPPAIHDSGTATGMPVRVVDNSSAPAYRMIDPDISHPFRMTELLGELRSRLSKEILCNGFDILAVRKVYRIDGEQKYTHRSKFGSRQYSQAFVDWIVESCRKDPAFLSKARSKYQRSSAMASNHALQRSGPEAGR